MDERKLIKYSAIVTKWSVILGVLWGVTIGVLDYTYIPYKVNEKNAEIKKLYVENQNLKKNLTTIKKENDILNEKIGLHKEESQNILDELNTYKQIALDQIAKNSSKNKVEQNGIITIPPNDIEVRKKRIEIENLLVDSYMDGATNGVSILLKYSLDNSVEAEALKIILTNLNMEVHMLETENVDKAQRGIIKWKKSDSAMYAKVSLNKMLSKFTGTTKTKVDNSLSTMLELSL